MNKILVVNGGSYAAAVKGLCEIVTDIAELFKNPEEFKLILFTGGADVTPEYYNESSPKRYCMSNTERDRQESEIFKFARKHNIRTIGICRGVQFINVMSGGTMYHHVTNHENGMHYMKTESGPEIKINSYHHQMIIPPRSAYVIGWAAENLSTCYIGDYDRPTTSPYREPEAALFPNTESAGVQYHPEAMSQGSNGYLWFYNLAKMLIEEPDFSLIIKHYTERTCNKPQSRTLVAQ